MHNLSEELNTWKLPTAQSLVLEILALPQACVGTRPGAFPPRGHSSPCKAQLTGLLPRGFGSWTSPHPCAASPRHPPWTGAWVCPPAT